MPSQKEDEILEGLKQDIIAGQKTVASSAQGKGVAEDKSVQGYGLKALRIKGKTFGEKELSDIKTKFNEVMNDVVNTGQFANDQERSKFRSQLEQKMNRFQMDMIRRGSQMDHQMKAQNLKDEQQSQMTTMFASTITNLTTYGIANGLKKPSGDGSVGGGGGGGYAGGGTGSTPMTGGGY